MAFSHYSKGLSFTKEPLRMATLCELDSGLEDVRKDVVATPDFRLWSTSNLKKTCSMKHKDIVAMVIILWIFRYL